MAWRDRRLMREAGSSDGTDVDGGDGGGGRPSGGDPLQGVDDARDEARDRGGSGSSGGSGGGRSSGGDPGQAIDDARDEARDRGPTPEQERRIQDRTEEAREQAGRVGDPRESQPEPADSRPGGDQTIGLPGDPSAIPEAVDPELVNRRREAIRQEIIRDPDVSRFDATPDSEDIQRIGPGAFEVTFGVGLDEPEETRRFAFNERGQQLFRERQRERAVGDFVSQFESVTGQDIEEEDVAVTEQDGQFLLGLTAEATGELTGDETTRAEEFGGMPLGPLSSEGTTTRFEEFGSIGRDPDVENIIQRFEEFGAVGPSPNRQEVAQTVAERQARRQIEGSLEEQLGIDLTQSDIQFEQTDEGLIGRPTIEAQEEARVADRPIQQLAEGTPVEEIFGVAGQFSAGLSAGRRRRREAISEEINLADESEAFLRDVGLGGGIDAFENLQASTQAEFEQFRGSIFSGAESVAEDVGPTLGAAAVVSGVGPATIAAEEAMDAGVPSPAEEPEAFATAAAPVAAVEPTPFGEFAIGAAVGGGAALAASERVNQPDVDPAQAQATAEIPGLFPPDQQVPEDRGLFTPEQDVEPPSFDLPEFLPPTEPVGNFGGGRLMPPEIEQPQDPIGRGFFPAEQAQPEEPIGRGFFAPEQGIPTLETAGQQLIGQPESVGETERPTRRRREPAIPGTFIPDEPQVIGGTGQTPGEATEPSVSGGFGPSFIFRPNPRSMELRRIETEEGGFRIGPEFTRFLGAQTLDADLEPEIEPFQATGTLPPTTQIGGEFAMAGAFGIAAQRESAGVDSLSREIFGFDIGQQPATTPATDTTPATATQTAQAQRTATRTAQATRAATSTRTATEAFANPFESVVERPFEPVGFPTLFSPAPASTPEFPLGLPEGGDDDERREELVATGQELQNPIASGFEFLFGRQAGDLGTGGPFDDLGGEEQANDMLSLFGGGR